MGLVTHQSDEDFLAGLEYANSYVAATVDFLEATGGVLATDPITLPIRKPLMLLRSRILAAYFKRTGLQWPAHP